MARLPSSWTFFYHPGHTIQLEENSDNGARAYYLHRGSKDLGYAGVPSDWDGEFSFCANNMFMHVDTCRFNDD